MIPPARPRRSVLFLPASNSRAIAKSRTLACDAVVLDLEDAVAPDAKAAARAAAAAAVAEGGWGPRELVIRVNGPDTPWGADDLAALAEAAPDAVLLPKVASVDAVADVRARLGERGPAIWAMVETCRGVLDAGLWAQAGRAHGLALLAAGTNDLAREMRCRPGHDRAALVPALSQVVLAARAAGLAVLDGVCNAVDDPDRVAAECSQALELGFDGKTLIHPGQIAPANRVFTPDMEEVARARAIAAAFDDPARAGLGAIRVDGRMVERLHAEEARALLALAAACDERGGAG